MDDHRVIIRRETDPDPTGIPARLHLSYNDERRVRRIVLQELRDIAAWLEAHDCQRCRAHDEHEVCDFPDVARAIREVCHG